MAYIDYSSDSNSTKSPKNILEDDNIEFDISLTDLGRPNKGSLTPSMLKNHEKQFEQENSRFIPIEHMHELEEGTKTGTEKIKKNISELSVEQQINENSNMALVYGFAENLDILRSMNEEICERLDWVTQQTQQITEQFNEDRDEARRERKFDRYLDIGISILETSFFVVGIIYATILFMIEMYYNYSVNFHFI
jgi:hypothetical protein